jgi:hypothetical protein
MKINWRTTRKKDGTKASVPVIDVRNGEAERKEAEAILKASRGCNSKYIPNRHLSRY